MSSESQKTSLESDGDYLPSRIWREIDRVSKTKKLSSSQKEKLVEAVRKEYERSSFEPGEAIGIVSAQSISEPATQLSIHGDEKIIIKENGQVRIVRIGEFIDGLIQENGFERVRGAEVHDLSEDVFALSMDGNGKTRWKRILSAIRHRSPKKLLEIKTKSGRRIVATDHHSFVIRKNLKIVPVSGKSLKAGDRIPVIRRFPAGNGKTFDLGEIFDKGQYWFGTELTKAFEMESGYIRGHGKNYTVPVGVDQLRNHIQGRSTFEIQQGFVYPVQNHGSALIPERLELDELFGWFVGAYIAEGNSTKYYTSISNTNENLLRRARKTAKVWNLTFNEYDNAWGGHDSRINSSIISEFMRITCGTGAENKRIPDFAFSANEKFVCNLLRGYFDGDGNITVQRRAIRCHSVSKELIAGIGILLSRLGIFSYRYEEGNKHVLSIPYKYADVFLEKIGSDIKKRVHKLKKLCSAKGQARQQDFTDMISGFDDILYSMAKKVGMPTRLINSFTKRQRIGRRTLEKYVNIFENLSIEKSVDMDEELKILKKILDEDVVWDAIEEIKYVDSGCDYVYDISVPGLETFTTFEGIVTHNTMRTFHFAASAGVQITLGLPRLIEIFDARKESTTPVMTLYLKSKYNTQAKAEKFAKEIRERRLRHYVDTVSIDLTNRKIRAELQKVKKRELKEIVQKLEKALKDYKVKTRRGKLEIEPKEKEVTVKELEKVKKKILALHVIGLQGVKNTLVIKEGKDWIIKTLGSNFAKILLLEEIDTKRCYTNNIHEIAKVLGIEAARTALIKEINETIQQQGLDIDERHINLVADIMTLVGDIKAVGRYGVAGMKSSVLARAGFEETIKHLVKASVRGEIDTFDGIFDNVMINHQVPVGTGMFELVAKMGEEE